MMRIVRLLMMMLLLISCSNDASETKNPMPTDISSKPFISQETANQAVELALNKEEVIKANAINTDKYLLLAFEVKQFDRFRLQSIEKTIKDELKKEFKDLKVEVSYDPKIMLEIEKVQEKMEAEEMDKESLKKEMKRIVKLKHEKT